MREGSAVYALFSICAAIAGGGVRASEADGAVPPRQMCNPSLSNGTIFDYNLPGLYQNETIDLSALRGKLTLVVNVASF